MRKIVSLVAKATFASASVSGWCGTISIEISGLKSNSGHIAYALFNSEDGFPSDKTKAFKRAFVPFQTTVDTDTAKLTILDVPPGDYALLLYEDLNRNQILDKNFLGIPREPVGASNNPSYHFGPPKYRESMFSLAGPESNLAIKMVH